MAKRRPRKPKGTIQGAHPRIVGAGLTIPAGQLSLPPVGVGTISLTPPPPPEDTRVACPKCGTLTKKHICPICEEKVAQPIWRLPDDSIVRERAMKIIAFRLGGMSDDEIAKYLGIGRRSIGPYIYRAGKNGWLDYNSPREAIENGLAHKVLRNLNAMLDNGDDAATQREVTLEVAKGTIFKAFDQDRGAQVEQAAPVVALQVVITKPEQAALPPIREGTLGGVPNYVEGAVIDRVAGFSVSGGLLAGREVSSDEAVPGDPAPRGSHPPGRGDTPSDSSDSD